VAHLLSCATVRQKTRHLNYAIYGIEITIVTQLGAPPARHFCAKNAPPKTSIAQVAHAVHHFRLSATIRTKEKEGARLCVIRRRQT
jgi:hypothetical protein